MTLFQGGGGGGVRKMLDFGPSKRMEIFSILHVYFTHSLNADLVLSRVAHALIF